VRTTVRHPISALLFGQLHRHALISIFFSRQSTDRTGFQEWTVPDLHKHFHNINFFFHSSSLGSFPSSITPTNMPRGKAWSRAESIALVEAFIHISEDEIIGINQRADTLYERVVAEAKTRFAGDWHRGVLACKGRWLTVSREVQKFIGVDLLIQSVPRSGWNEKNYYDAAVKAYFSSKPDFNMEMIVDEDSLVFEFKEEWEILRDHEKWHATLSKQEKKRQNMGSPCSEDALSRADNESDISLPSSVARPSGVKKAKTIQSLSDRTESFLQSFKDQNAKGEENQKTAVMEMMAQMKESSIANLEKLEKIVSTSTNKLTETMTSSNNKWADTMNIKLLMQLDLSKMSSTFQKKARKRLQKHFEETVLCGIDPATSDSDDNEDNDSTN
jgi:hypothetical protein